MDINISYKRDMNHSYILFSGGTIETENYQVQMVLHRLLPGLLPCCVYSLDNQQVWCCENTSMQKLSVYCQIHALGMKELTWIYGSLLKSLQDLQEYLMNPNTIYLTPDELYVDPFKCQVQCCLVPFYEKDIWKSLLELSQYLLGYLNQQDSDAVALAYGIFRYLSQGGSSLEALWTMLYGRQQEESAKNGRVFGAKTDRWIQKSSAVEQNRKSNEYNEKDKQNKNLTELDMAEKEKIAEIDLEMELQRQRDLDEIFRKKEDFTKNRWKWPAWLSRWKREKPQKEEKQLKEAMDMEEKMEFREEKSTMLQQRDERVEECEESEGATMLLSAAQMVPQAMLIHEISKEKFMLEQPVVVIGKMPGAAQLILKEATVSRIHARIIHREDGDYLEDMNSKNGTYVNGELLDSQKQVKLKNGDKICFADVLHTYILG